MYLCSCPTGCFRIAMVDVSPCGGGVIWDLMGKMIGLAGYGWSREGGYRLGELATLMKWLPKLMGFDYEILYKKRSENYAADALSRVPTSSQILQMILTTVTTDLLSRIVNGWEADPVLQTIIQRLKKELVKHYSWTHDQLRRRGKLVVGNDQELKKDLLVHFHADSVGGHSGSTATTNRISGICYWKKMRQDVKTFMALCSTEISIDFIKGLPLSNGKSVILKVVDRLREKPKEWSKWLSLTEYWYNTNFYTSIQTTPYEAVYGQPPPSPIAYIQGPLPNATATLPVCDAQGDLLQQPVKVLDIRLGKVGCLLGAVYVCDIRTSYVSHQCTNSNEDNAVPCLLRGLAVLDWLVLAS
ncbi:reverse transcriptase [Tanacetum coccineum]